MANESTYALISHLIPTIWEEVLQYMNERFVMHRLVRTFTDRQGMATRKVTEWLDDTQNIQTNLGETEDLDAVELVREWLATLTPAEIGKQYNITDRRVETEADILNIMSDAVKFLGQSIGRQVESDLLGLLPGLTGGSTGDASNRMSMDYLYWARTKLEGMNVPPPYTTVLHPYQFRDIHTDFVTLSNAAPLDIRNEFQRNYYVTRVADFNIVVSSLLPTTMTTGRTYSVDLGGATGGTYKIVWNGQTTAAIAYDAVEGTIDAAIAALDGIDAADIVVEDTTSVPTGYDFMITLATALISETPNISIVSANLTGCTEAPHVTLTDEGAGYFNGGMWNKEALALDIRRGLRIEPERDASLRSTELNATMIKAQGIWRPNWGVILKSDATLSDPS